MKRSEKPAVAAQIGPETSQNAAEAAQSVARDTLLGDLVSIVIDEMKAAPDVWQKLSEFAQDDVIHRVQKRCTKVIADVVNIVASEHRPTVAATVDSVTMKDGIKVVLKLPKTDPQRHELFDAQGREVLIVVAGARDFLVGEMPKADAQQPALELPEDTPPVNQFGEGERAAA